MLEVVIGQLAGQVLGVEVVGFIGPLHLEARDVVRSNDREKALEFYRQRIAIEDPQRCEALVRHGVLARFPQLRQAIDQLRAGAMNKPVSG